MALPRLKYFIQCDEVRNETGKFSAIGIFDAIFSLIFPARHKRFFLLLGFTGDEGRFAVELQFAAPSGSAVAGAKGELVLVDGQVSNLVFGFENFPLPEQGEYRISLFLDGDFFAEQTFHARRPVAAQERTPEQVQMLLARPDIVKSANVEIACDRCRTAYRFQHHLDPNTPPDEGFLQLPPGDVFACSVCGAHIRISQLRQNLENIVGVPRQWLGNPDQPPGASPSPPPEHPES